MTPADISVWATFGATAATAVATGVLAWFTWVMAGATRRMAEAASQPAVVVTMEPSRWSFIHTDLVIENTGNAAAFDVRVEFDPPIQREVNGRSEDVPFNIISVLRPGYAIRNFVGNGSAFMEHSHRATVTWAGAPNSKHRERISYDVGLQHFEGVTMLGSGDPLVKVAEEMKKMREELQRHR